MRITEVESLIRQMHRIKVLIGVPLPDGLHYYFSERQRRMIELALMAMLAQRRKNAARQNLERHELGIKPLNQAPSRSSS